MNKVKNTKGVTLVALVVTVVVLLILAGITITYVLGDNGIIKLAQDAKNKTEEAIRNEQGDFGNLENMLKNEHGGGNGDIVNPPEPPTEEIEETVAFSRANGVIDIVWLNKNNTVRTESEGPLSQKDSLGNLTAIKYDGTK